MSNRKDTIINLIVRLTKKALNETPLNAIPLYKYESILS